MIRITWVIGGETHVVDVDVPRDGEVTFTATTALWDELTSGRVDPVVAFMQGRLKMSGEHAALYALLPTFPLPAP